LPFNFHIGMNCERYDILPNSYVISCWIHY
jgi:hypothetical protein